jgi:phytoene desaturase
MDSFNGATAPFSSQSSTSGVHPVVMQEPSRPLPASPASPPRTGERSDGRPHAVVIGAGLGGLSTAIHLARQGWQVDIIERNTRSGGRMNVIEQDGFRIDMGPTMLMMPEVIEKTFEACGRDIKDYLQMQRLTPAYTMVWPDGAKFAMGGSVAEMEESVRRFAPEDSARFPALLAGMKAKYENARHNFIEQSFNSLRDMVRPSTLRGMVQSLPLESVFKFVSRYIKNDRLRQAFTFQTLYLGISPYDCPAIYALLPYIEMEFGVWFPQGGTIALADALEKLFTELGGRIHYCNPVERILLEGRRAVGVQTQDGERWQADTVVCNLDVPTAYKHLLPPAIRRKHTDKALARREYGCSGYLLYLGVKHIPSDWSHNTIVLSERYDEVLADICVHKRLPRDPAMHVCIPTRTDPSLAPPGHDVVYVLVPCPNAQADIDWETEGPLLRERVLAKLEASGLPGLRESIVFEKSFTPPEFEAVYGCYAGAAYSGLSPTFMQSAYFRPHSRSEEVADLYFVGASTHPGGGVPIVLTSGRLAAEEIVAARRK